MGAKNVLDEKEQKEEKAFCLRGFPLPLSPRRAPFGMGTSGCIASTKSGRATRFLFCFLFCRKPSVKEM